MLPAPVASLLRDWPPDPPGQGATRRQLSRLWRALDTQQIDTGQPMFAGFVYVGSYPHIFYLPQAIGLWAAYHLGLTPLSQFYAGRLAAAAVALTMVFLAVQAMQESGLVFLLVALLPGVCSQFGSYSADSMIFASAFLSTAMLLRVPQPSRQTVMLLPLVSLLALAKGVYLPIAIAGMGKRAAWRPRNLAWMAMGLTTGLVLFTAWYGFAVSGDLEQNLQQYVSSRTLQHVTAARPHEQLDFIMAHLGTAIWAVMSTIVERAPVYVIDCIGRFGAFNVRLPLLLYGLGLVVLLGAFLVASPQAPMPTSLQRCLWTGIAVVTVVLIHVALYMTATARGETYVEGVQGRYFIPILPLFLLGLRVRVGEVTAQITRLFLPLAAVLLVAGGLAEAATAFWRW